jgi:hypothetical protein
MIEIRPDDRSEASIASSRDLRGPISLASIIFLTSFLTGCTSQPETERATTIATSQTSPKQYPDVVSVDVDVESDGTYRFEVTISSPYDSPERYADAWRILAPDGTQLAIRELLHDHATEQPFTRSLSGVELPEGIETVTVEGRDLEYGWGGATVDVDVSEISP